MKNHTHVVHVPVETELYNMISIIILEVLIIKIANNTQYPRAEL